MMMMMVVVMMMIMMMMIMVVTSQSLRQNQSPPCQCRRHHAPSCGWSRHQQSHCDYHDQLLIMIIIYQHYKVNDETHQLIIEIIMKIIKGWLLIKSRGYWHHSRRVAPLDHWFKLAAVARPAKSKFLSKLTCQKKLKKILSLSLRNCPVFVKPFVLQKILFLSFLPVVLQGFSSSNLKPGFKFIRDRLVACPPLTTLLKHWW